MECKECGTEVDQYTASLFNISNTNITLCFSCYLESDIHFHNYDDDELFSIDDENKELAREALRDKLRYVIFFYITEDAQESIFAFTRNEADTDTLQQTVLNSELNQFIEDAGSFHLSDVYGDFDKSICWGASKWEHSPLGLTGRTGSTQVSIINDTPCLTDAYSRLQDGTRNELEEALLTQFLDMVGTEPIEALGDIRPKVSNEFPVATSFGIYPRARDYFRNNSYLLSDQSQKMIENTANGEKFERFFADLASEAGLNNTRGQASNQLPDTAYEDVQSLDIRFGIPDYFVWGDTDELTQFVNNHGFADFEAPKHESGIFVEVKYTSLDSNREFYQENQKEIFPKLQDEGFDVLIFKGTNDDYCLERYADDNTSSEE